jgi:hypothetical protein
MGELLNIDPKHQMRLCLLDGAACELGSRGCGLHTQAITLRIVMARQLGKNLVAATVSPTNLISLRGLFRQGFIIQKYAEVYGGLPRLLLVRDLQTQSHAWQHILVVANTDFQGHCAALQLGLSGYGCIQDHDHSWLISYGMRAAS